MGWEFVLVILIVIAVAALTYLKRVDNSLALNVLRYEKLPSLLSPAERSFFGVLSNAVSADVEVFTKVRVADVIKPSKGTKKGEWQIAFNKISAKHFDFVICDKKDLNVVCVIELDDKSHQKSKTAKRDEFLMQACKSSNLPLIRIRAAKSYKVAELRELLGQYLSLGNRITETSETNAQKCPKCKLDLVLRLAKKGKHAGKKFMACTSYPKCKFTQVVALSMTLPGELSQSLTE